MKYFNKDTGIEGRSYTKKTKKAICDELGNEAAMEAYVREIGLPSDGEL